MLLPVRDSVGGALGFKVFEDVERYLKDSDWCYYTSNSEILNILSNYKRNLDSVLTNPEVLKIISEKTKTGSLMKVDIVNQVIFAMLKSTFVSLKVQFYHRCV